MTCDRRDEQVWKAPSPQRPCVRMRMGLYASRAIVHKHHGEISVESEVGVGTTFTVTFPDNLESIIRQPGEREDANRGKKRSVGNSIHD
jgi:hypothetical protein